MLISKRRYFVLSVILFIHIGIFTMITSCEKETGSGPAPEIRFVIEDGYTDGDTTLLLSESVKIGIIADSKDGDNITQFHYEILADSMLTSIDSGLNSEYFRHDFVIQKGISYKETWTFSVRNRYGKESQKISITLTKDSASIFGDIIHIPSLVFGAQNNTNTGSFYSFETDIIYNQNQAFLNQNLIDMLYFYDPLLLDENTISSPNANIEASVFPAQSSGDTLGLINWSVRNVTRFKYLDAVSVADFDDCTHDSLLLMNTFIFPTGNRKAKNLKAGDIYSFILHDETTKGIFKVKNVSGTDQGTIEIEIKIQDFND